MADVNTYIRASEPLSLYGRPVPLAEARLADGVDSLRGAPRKVAIEPNTSSRDIPSRMRRRSSVSLASSS
jgi:hypothetical protein